MKIASSLLLIAVSIIITSCSSPEKEGNNLGVKYCNCLGEIKSNSNILPLHHKKDSCDAIIQNDWSKYETEYKLDAEKWRQFTFAYNNTTQKTFEEYNSKLSSLMNEISSTINRTINGNIWVKEEEKNTLFYLIKFENNYFSAINCKGAFKYKLFADTLKFNDRNNTNIILEITSDKNLTVSDLNKKSKVTYHIAQLKDKIIGRWNVSNTVAVSLFADGSCTVGQGYSVKSTSYTFKDNVLNIGGVGAYKITMLNMDAFAFGQAYFKRIKVTLPETVDFLFKNQNQIN